MKNVIPRLPLILYAIIGSMSLVVVACWYQFATPTFFDRTIGGFILSEANIASRNVYYTLGIVIAFCVFSSVAWLTRAELFSSIRYRTLSASTLMPTYMLAAIAAVNAILYLVYKDPIYGNALGLLLLTYAMQLALARFLRLDMSLAAGVWIQVLAYQLSLSVLLLSTQGSQLGFQFFALFLASGFALAVLYQKAGELGLLDVPLSMASTGTLAGE